MKHQYVNKILVIAESKNLKKDPQCDEWKGYKVCPKKVSGVVSQKCSIQTTNFPLQNNSPGVSHTLASVRLLRREVALASSRALNKASIAAFLCSHAED